MGSLIGANADDLTVQLANSVIEEGVLLPLMRVGGKQKFKVSDLTFMSIPGAISGKKKLTSRN